MIEEVKKHSNVLFNLNFDNDYLNVTFEKIAKEKSNFEIIDANGKTVATYNDLTISQNGQMQFSINSLSKGIYFLRV
jgi:hypothetical protein